ncbi:hypothetical protein K8I31_16735 [bacterium]|nr:hypothetical protein [bacterium]
METRKVYYAVCATNPKSEWVEQNARQFCWYLNENNLPIKYLIRDRDGKFSPKFDAIIESEGIKVKRLPVKAPNLNAWVESWIGSLKRECINHFFVINEKHLDQDFEIARPGATPWNSPNYPISFHL